MRTRLYIAACSSCAVQHRAVMDKSNKIIAINTDPNAPIFQVAHYKIVGDLAEVLPLLIKTLREKAKSVHRRDAESAEIKTQRTQRLCGKKALYKKDHGSNHER